MVHLPSMTWQLHVNAIKAIAINQSLTLCESSWSPSIIYHYQDYHWQSSHSFTARWPLVQIQSWNLLQLGLGISGRASLLDLPYQGLATGRWCFKAIGASGRLQLIIRNFQHLQLAALSVWILSCCFEIQSPWQCMRWISHLLCMPQRIAIGRGRSRVQRGRGKEVVYRWDFLSVEWGWWGIVHPLVYLCCHC